MCLGAILCTTGCKTSPQKDTGQANKVDTVAAFILKKDTIKKAISFPGELIPLERAEIFAKVQGYIKNLSVDIGDKVRGGQIIAVLDAPEVISNYAQANSDVQTARSKYAGTLDTYTRLRDASKTPGAIAPGDLERARSQMQADSAAYEAQKYKLDAYQQIKDYLTVRAPFSGVITQRNVDPGTLVGASNARPMLVIENNDTLRLRLPIPETYTSAIPVNSTISFSVDAYPGMPFEARLSRKSDALNLNNRTEIWEFLYANKDKKLKSGMFANASVNFSRSAPAFVVPASAVVTNLEKRFVIRLNAGKAVLVDTRNGIAFDNKMEIFGNLAEGDTLITRGTDEIKPGKEFIPVLQLK